MDDFTVVTKKKRTERVNEANQPHLANQPHPAPWKQKGRIQKSLTNNGNDVKLASTVQRTAALSTAKPGPSLYTKSARPTLSTAKPAALTLLTKSTIPTPSTAKAAAHHTDARQTRDR